MKDKKTPLLNLDEKLMMEAGLLQKNKEVLLLLPTFPLIVKRSPVSSRGTALSRLPTCKPHKRPILITSYLSLCLLLDSSALKHKGLGPLWIPPETPPIGVNFTSDDSQLQAFEL